LLGLYRYWPLADAPTRQRIEQIFREVSRRWRAGYVIHYFGEAWDMEKSYPRAQQHMFLWMVMHRLAYELTGEPERLDEFQRLRALYANMPTPRETEWGLGHPAYTSTEARSRHVQMVIGGELLLELEPADRARWLRGMESWWRYSLIGRRDDLASYYFIRIAPLTGEWGKRPAAIKPRALWRSPCMLTNAVLPICWLGPPERQAISRAIVARHAPAPAGPATARFQRLYTELDKGDLKWFSYPAEVMPAPLQRMLNVMQGDALAFYSLVYWSDRAHPAETNFSPE